MGSGRRRYAVKRESYGYSEKRESYGYSEKRMSYVERGQKGKGWSFRMLREGVRPGGAGVRKSRSSIVGENRAGYRKNVRKGGDVLVSREGSRRVSTTIRGDAEAGAAGGRSLAKLKDVLSIALPQHVFIKGHGRAMQHCIDGGNGEKFSRLFNP